MILMRLSRLASRVCRPQVAQTLRAACISGAVECAPALLETLDSVGGQLGLSDLRDVRLRHCFLQPDAGVQSQSALALVAQCVGNLRK